MNQKRLSQMLTLPIDDNSYTLINTEITMGYYLLTTNFLKVEITLSFYKGLDGASGGGNDRNRGTAVEGVRRNCYSPIRNQDCDEVCAVSEGSVADRLNIRTKYSLLNRETHAGLILKIG